MKINRKEINMDVLGKNDNTLNIFCDASIAKRDNITIGCPGVVVPMYINTSPCSYYTNYDILYDTTNNNSEITAILLGVYEALKYKDKYSIINLFSDSKICIEGLRSWIFNWANNINSEGLLCSSSGSLVANQEVFKRIIWTIQQNNLRIRFYHQKGHVSISSDQSMRKAADVFYNSNKILLNLDDICTISTFNNTVDIITKNVLKE